MKKKISAERARAGQAARSKRSEASEPPGRLRGRPPRVPPSLVQGRADFIESNLKRCWDTLRPRLLEAKTVADVAEAFEVGAVPHVGQVVSPNWHGLVLQVLDERKFPKTKNAQIRFLATSIAGWGEISPRRSRDITHAERKKLQARHRILRVEFYIECSCGYKGPSMDHACPKCSATIALAGFA